MSRSKWVPDAQGTDLAIIVTPMLDMAFQLLAFFIMTYHPPVREAIVDDTLLPAAQQKGKSAPAKSDQKAEKEKKEKKDPEIKATLQVHIIAVPRGKAAKGETLAPGQPKQILLFKPLQPDPGPSLTITLKLRGATPNDPPADFEAALEKLKKELSSADKNLPLDISASRDLKYSYVARLRDVIGPLGFKRIGFNEPP